MENITEPAVARVILERLGMPTDPPVTARARDPTEANVVEDDSAD
jgi:hypothetical protein